MSRTIVRILSGFLLLSSALAWNNYALLNYDAAHAEKELARRSTTFLDEKNIAPLRIRFNAYNRFFHLVLRPISPDSPTFTEDFKVFMNNTHHVIRPNLFLYEGYVKGDPKSLVYGSLFDGIFDGHIYLSDGNSFTIEKAAKYYSAHERTFHSIILHENERHMRSVKPLPVNLYASYSYKDESLADFAARRARRYIFDKDAMGRYSGRTCNMHLQADHRLYAQVFDKEGMNDPIRTLEEIVSMFYVHIRFANEVFETSIFNGVQGINFAIKQISIFTPDECSRQNGQYRVCKNHPDIGKYFNAFIETDYSHFCLSYGFTYSQFQGVTIGMANTAHRLEGEPEGGLCGAYKVNLLEGRSLSTNTGVLTFRSHEGYRLRPRATEIVFAHELGHSLGATHDNANGAKHPDGTYLMYPRVDSSTVGDKPNHAKFSQQSIANISAALDAVLRIEPDDPSEKLPMRWLKGLTRNCLQ